MADTLNQTQLSQIVSAVIQALQVQNAASTKPAPQFKNSFDRYDFAAKDRSLISAFSRRGFKDVRLGVRDAAGKIDNTNANVRPYRVWIELGRRVRKGERGTRGLFHQDQTDLIQPKAEMTPERRGMFKKAAAKAKQPQLVK